MHLRTNTIVETEDEPVRADTARILDFRSVRERSCSGDGISIARSDDHQFANQLEMPSHFSRHFRTAHARPRGHSVRQPRGLRLRMREQQGRARCAVRSETAQYPVRDARTKARERRKSAVARSDLELRNRFYTEP